ACGSLVRSRSGKVSQAAVTTFLCPTFVFFFSSRRRHTRFSRDWSSDVCSSDLDGGDRDGRHAPGGQPPPRLVWGVDLRAAGQARSEERRVGKEWRSRWALYLLETKSC